MDRYTKRVTKAKILTIKASDQNAIVAVNATIVGKASDPRWTVFVSVTANGEESVYQVGDDSGKVRFFQTLDAVVKFVAEINEDGKGEYKLNIFSMAAYASAVPANVYTAAEAKIVKLNKLRAQQIEKAVALAALTDVGGPYHGWDTGNAAQRARFEETQWQQAAVDGDITAIDNEVAGLQALVDSQP